MVILYILGSRQLFSIQAFSHEWFWKKKEILTFDTSNKSNVINRMLIWSLCVKGLLFILYHNQNGSKIEIVSSVYNDLNNFLMEKAFD